MRIHLMGASIVSCVCVSVDESVVADPPTMLIAPTEAVERASNVSRCSTGLVTIAA